MTAPDCPFPTTCPVGDPATLKLTGLRLHTVDVDQQLHNVASASYLTDTFNDSGRGSGRFSPILDEGEPTGHLYVGSTRIAALLETAFHDIGPGRTDAIDEANDLAGWHLRTLVPRRPLKLVDLRDPSLERMRLPRPTLISTSPAHYPCTRQWAHRIRSWRRAHDGFIWNSRIAEIAATQSPLMDALKDTSFDEAMVLFDDHPAARDLDIATNPDDLAHPGQRALVDDLAHLLDVAIL